MSERVSYSEGAQSGSRSSSDNFFHISNNDNLNNNVHDPTDLVYGSLWHIFTCGSRHSLFHDK